ncbi:MAG: hypothetical protein ACPGQS_09640 [Bradymonadia bacterium]
MKPNPFLVARQPQAKVRGNIVRSNAQKARPVAVANGDAFAFIVDRITRADLVTEGAVYESESPRRFYGSAVLTIRRQSDPTMVVPEIEIGLLNDPRFSRLVEARVYQELLRHLGAETPAVFDWSGRESLESGEHRVYMDVECTLADSGRSTAQVGT